MYRIICLGNVFVFFSYWYRFIKNVFCSLKGIYLVIVYGLY